MNTFKRFLNAVGATFSLNLLFSLLLFAAAPAGAQPFTNAVFFTGNIALDGDISDFFMPDGLTVRPGVCLVNDPNGLDESPLSSGSTLDTFSHPSGFNQRRVMTAFNPNLNGGTIFIGIDLPGGTGADSSSKTVHGFAGNANPNYFDGTVGSTNGSGRGKIVPFDADANGEADTIGRKANGADLFRCMDFLAGDTFDIVSCSAGSQGLTDNPRTASGEILGARENYVATIILGNVFSVTVELVETSASGPGAAQLSISSTPSAPFGGMASTSTSGTGAVLGFDVEFAVTNVNNAVPDICARLHQIIIVDSGSNRDGGSQGEDQNTIECTYNLPRGLIVTKQCPTNPVAPGGQLTFTGSVRNTGQVDIVNLAVFNDKPVANTPVPLSKTTLAPGEVLLFTNNYLVPANFTNCSITDTLTATGLACSVAVTGVGSATCTISNALVVVCPPATNVQCFADIPPPNTNSVIVTGGVPPITVLFLNDVLVTNGCVITNTRTYRVFDSCRSTNTCDQIIVVRDTNPPSITCPTNLSVQCLTNVPPCPTNLAQFRALGGAAVDNCDTNLSYSCADGPLVGGTCGGTISRRHAVVDRCGNSNSCVQTITVRDTILPTITCPGEITVQCVTNVPPCPTTLAQFLALGGTASDNCDSNLTYSCTDGPLIGGTCGGTISRTHTVTDDCTNSASCVQIIRVRDTILPTIVCPPEIAVQCLTNVPACPTNLAQFRALGGQANDNCDTNLEYRCSDGPYVGDSCSGTISRTHMVIDDCTNSVSCVQIIRIRDTIQPVILTCPSNITVACLGDVPPCATNFAQFLARGGAATDNCATNLGYRCSDAPLTGGQCGGQIVRTHTVLDNCTNAASCTQIITVTSPPPVVVTGLTNILACATSNATFCVDVSSVCGVTYQWFKDRVSIPGATNRCYTVTNIVPSNTGEYCVVASAVCGSVTNCARLTVYGALGDFVWYDKNSNGVQEANEPGLPNVVVQLMNCAGQVLQSTNTDTNGAYLFIKLVPGDYKVTFTNGPFGFFFTIPNAGGDDARDSDANPVSGMTQCVTIGSGETNRTVDGGYYTLPPSICVVKEVACLLPGNSCGAFGKSATGYRTDSQLPAFCYRIVISNCGPYAMTNVTVMDNKLGDLTTNYFASRLTVFPVGQALTNFFKMAWGVDTTNVVTVTGTSVVEGHSATNQDFALALIDRASVVCQTYVTSPDDIDGNANDNHVQLPTNSQAHQVTFITVVCNNGEAGLMDVQLNNPVLAGLGCGSGAPFGLAAGACVTNVCVVSLSCTQAPVVSSTLVTASVDTQGGAACGWDINGSNITVSSRCDGRVDMECPCDLRVSKTACVLGANGECADASIDSFSGECAQVKYTYVISNFGSIPANNVSVVDDRLGPVPGSPIATIGAGQSVTLMATGMVCCTLTNTVTVEAADGLCPPVSATAVVRKCVPLKACTPPYPFVSANPLTSIPFNESEVLRGFTVLVTNNCMPRQIRAFYNDEHAMVLGVRRVIVKTAGGTTTTDYPLTALSGNPGSALDPQVGSMALTGDQAGTDTSGRPLYPALFVTDITDDPSSLAGDWQYGGTGIAPHAVFGTWKGAVRTVDKTRTPANVDVQPDTDPAKNNWDLDGGDAAPPGLVNQGYGTEVRWDVERLGLVMGRTYRLYFMIHDGDQNKEGGDVGQGCAILGVGFSETCPPPACPDCELRYPFSSANPRTSIVFNESEVLRGFSTNVAGAGDTIKVWYNDEHALALGVRRIVVKSAGGTTTTDYPVTALTANPGSALFPQVGATALAGNQSGADASGRPVFPSLFITDITADPSSLAGDWQYGGTPIPPHAVFGTWKAMVRNVDATRNPPAVSFDVDADPAKNNWNLDGGDPAPASLVNQGYGAEVRWNINDLGLIPGHSYRLQFMVHDGDQNKQGGDVGQACTILCYGTNQPLLSALGDYVWQDLNGNGLQDGGEPGVANVTVRLMDCAGNLLRTTTTSGNGLYLFTGLAAGGYRVQFVPPAGLSFTIPNAGNDAADSDADQSSGVTTCYTLGAGETNRTVDAGLVSGPPPCLTLIKSADRPIINPGGAVTYTYVVSNSCDVTLSDLVVTDDNGTPGTAADDFVVGTVAQLLPGESVTLSKTVNVPVTLCAPGTSVPSGQIVTEILGNGNFKATFIQAFDVNDNTYGANAIGWGTKGHKFRDLTGSDHVSWQFRNGNGQVVLEFDQDYISAASTSLFPSGYGSLGLGGDGGMISGNAAYLLDFSSSLEENLNKAPFLNNLAQYTVDSPALSDPNSALWEYLMAYTVVIDKAAFGSSGPGAINIIDQHNSPGKRIVKMPVPCNSCVTNIAIVTAHAGAATLTASAQAQVCTTTNQTPPLSALGDYVWQDLNGNGLQDGGEPGVPNVTVRLMDCAGNLLRTTTTSGNGFYLFTGLAAGGYRVQFVPPAGLSFTIANAGNDAADSDADQSSGVTTCYTLGAGETNRTIDAGLVSGPPPCLTLIKSADRPIINPGGAVTYSYVVHNGCDVTLSDLIVTDDNGTPGTAADDFVVGTVAQLPPGQSVTLSKTVMVPVTLCAMDSSVPSGQIVTEILGNGNFKATFIQAFDVNDNTYGANAIGWGTKGHKFRDLTGSDHVSWQFRNGNGQVVLEFDQDYISAASTSLFPSGYGSLGLGGDGGLIFGNAGYLLDFSSSLEENLNKPPFLNNLAQYTVDSPALSDPNSGLWEYLMAYTVVIDKAAFGTSGPGAVNIIDQHNSPGKRTVKMPVPCNSCVTNIAIVTAHAGAATLTASAQAQVCITTNPVSRACLKVSEDCQPSTAVAGAIRYSGSVSNCGPNTLTDVTVTSSLSGLVKTIPTLPAGATSTYSFDYPAPVCGLNITSTVTANGRDSSGTTISASASATCAVPCQTGACIAVTKLVACLLPNDSCTPFGKVATAIRNDTQIPGFCYSITVSNCGTTTLTNVTVLDDKLASISTNFPSTLAAGQTATRFFKMAWGANTTNTVTATGRGPSGQTVTAHDNAVALVSRVITCDATITSVCDQDGQTNDSHVLLPNGAPCVVHFIVTVCNNGPVKLTNVVINCPALAGVGCFGGPVLIPALPVGVCVSKDCTVTMTCNTAPLINDVSVTAQVITNGACLYDLTGTNLIRQVNTTCRSVVECSQAPPGLQLQKRADKTTVAPGSPVTYTYTVRNTGGINLSDVRVFDDNGTPGFLGDDFTVGTVASLAPGATTDLSRTITLPTLLCADTTGEQTGMLISQVLSNGNIQASFIQSMNVNDNTYGVNSIGWGSRVHKFQDLTGSDQAQFQFKNTAGQVILDFQLDYISAAPTSQYPSGYGTLGVNGGDGRITTGNAASLLAFTTSLTDNLNKPPFLNNLAKYTVDSPALNDPNSSQWEYRNIYTVVVDKAAFGTSGYGSVTIVDQHNSPSKMGNFTPVPCGGCYTNIARATARAGSVTVSNTTAATAIVCTADAPPVTPGRCPVKADDWKKPTSAWTAPYTRGQTVVSLFSQGAAYADAASKTLGEAIDGKAGSKEVKDMLKEAVAAVLNAAAGDINYPLTLNEVISSVNAVLQSGDSKGQKDLKDLFKEANEARDCH